jgi:hypothetical protein
LLYFFEFWIDDDLAVSLLFVSSVIVSVYFRGFKKFNEGETSVTIGSPIAFESFGSFMKDSDSVFCSGVV